MAGEDAPSAGPKHVELRDDALGHSTEGFRVSTGPVGGKRGATGVAHVCESRIERDFGKLFDAFSPDRPVVADAREHVDLRTTVRSAKSAHVLDRSQHRNVCLAKEIENLLAIQMRHVLRADDQDSTRKWHERQELLLEISCSRR